MKTATVKLLADLSALVINGKKASPVTPESKAEALILAKPIIADVPDAMLDVEDLNDDELDTYALEIGHKILAILRGK